MDRLLLHRLGKILYEIYNLQNYDISPSDYDKIKPYVLEAFSDIKPITTNKKLNPDIKEFVEQTNRRLKDVR